MNQKRDTDLKVLQLTRTLWKTHYGIGKFHSIMLKRNLNRSEQLIFDSLQDDLAHYRKELLPYGFDYMKEMVKYTEIEYFQNGGTFPTYDERMPVTYEFVKDLKTKVSISVNFESYIVKKDIHTFVCSIMENQDIGNKSTFNFLDVVANLEAHHLLKTKVGKKRKKTGYMKMTDLFHAEDTGRIRELRKILFIQISKDVYKCRIWKKF